MTYFYSSSKLYEFGLSRTIVLVVVSFIIIALENFEENDRHVPKTRAEKADP